MSNEKRYATIGALLMTASLFYCAAIPSKSINIYALGFAMLNGAGWSALAVAAYISENERRPKVYQSVTLGNITQTIGPITQEYDLRDFQEGDRDAE